MRRAHSLVLLALSMVACTGPAPAEWQAARNQQTTARAPAASGHQLMLRKQVVVDQKGLGYEVFRMLVPKDWNFSGGINWTYNKFPPEAKTAYTITSPEGNAVIEQFPSLNMFWSTAPMMQQSMAQSGFTILQPMEAVAFLKNLYIPHFRPDASGVKVVDSQPLPDLARRSLEINQFMMNVFAQISPFQFPFEQRSDSAHVKFEYTQGGRKMVEDATATIDYFITTNMSAFSGAVQSINWAPSVISFRAPAEDFDQKAAAYKIVIATHWDNPRWGVEYTRLLATITREQLRQQEAIFQRMQQIHRTQEEISDMIYEGYQRRSAAQDHIFDNYIQGLRGVETYNDPVNNWKVEIPVGYENAWTNGIDYVFSDNMQFDPNKGTTQNWQKMERQR